MRKEQGPEDKATAAAMPSSAKPELAPAAQRALAEAEERRRLGLITRPALPKEVDGRGGLEPIRYGDWEVKGIVSDF
jgi:hypothetical protein